MHQQSAGAGGLQRECTAGSSCVCKRKRQKQDPPPPGEGGRWAGVCTREQRLGRVGGGVLGRRAIIHHNAVGQVSGHDEVVLHYERRLLAVHDEALDHLCAGTGQPRSLSRDMAALVNSEKGAVSLIYETGEEMI